MDFEQAIVAGIVEQYFKPIPSGFNADGTYAYGYPAPAVSVALDLYQAKRSEILEAVLAAVDYDKMANQMATRILSDLSERRSFFSSAPTDGQKFQSEVRKRVIEKLADIQVLALLAEETKDD